MEVPNDAAAVAQVAGSVSSIASMSSTPSKNVASSRPRHVFAPRDVGHPRERLRHMLKLLVSW